MKSKLLSAITFIILMLAAACSTSRRAASDGAGADSLPPRTESSLIADLAASYGQWFDISAPVKLNIVTPKKLSVSGTLKMVRGSSIHLSLRMLGFEVGALYADADSVIVTARMVDAYMCESMSTLRNRYGLSLDDLQSLILGRLFCPGKGQISAADASLFTVTPAPDSPGVFTIVPDNLPTGATLVFTADTPADATAQLTTLIFAASAAPAIECTFGAPATSPAGDVAESVGFNTAVAGRDLQATIDLSVGRASWDSGLTTAKPDVKRYAKRIKGIEALRILSNL